jgi:hypothetical protein
MPKLITERFAYEGGTVDRTGPRPIVRGVLLCGATSANRRRYKKEAFAGARVKRYNGVPVYLNHGDGRSPRRYEDRIAKVVNARHRADGMPIGDLEVRPKHPFAEAFLDDATHDPTSLGMSHVAHCATETARDGWEDVREVAEVESVDVVLDPATTKGLFESTNRSGAAVKKLGAVLNHLKESADPRLRRAGRALVREAAAAGVMDEPAAPTTASDEVSAAVLATGAAILKRVLSGELDRTVGIRALNALVTTHDSLTASEDERDEPDAEQRRRKYAPPIFEDQGTTFARQYRAD